MNVSLVVPVYNEMATLAELLRRVVAVDLSKEIILVDDGSKDGSQDFLRRLAQEGLKALGPDVDAKNENVFTVLFQETNQGKGAAIRRGFQAAVGDVVMVQDADLEYNPQDIPSVVKPILDGHADVVFGSRFVGTPRRVLYFWHSLGNHLLTLLSNMATNLNLTDMETCYKAFRRDIIQGLTLEENRFGFEPEVTAKIAAGHFRVFEVPISYYGRTYEEGKKIGWKDGVRAFYVIAKYAVKR